MNGGPGVPVDDFRAGLIEEAGQARRLLDRVRAIDFEDVDPGSPMREVERELDDYSRRLLGIGEALQAADARSEAAPELSRRWQEATAARRAAWEALAGALASLAQALESEQGARAVDRMRLAESLRALARESDALRTQKEELAGLRSEITARDTGIEALGAELRQLQAALAERDATIARQAAEAARLESILNEEEHRLAARLRSRLAGHPVMAAIVRAPVRILSRLLGRSAP